MKTEIEQCPICEKVLSIKKGDNKTTKEKKHGVTWEFGYSNGGWGSRKDFMPSQSMEVCTACFDTIKDKVEELKSAINNRKGLNRPLISIS